MMPVIPEDHNEMTETSSEQGTTSTTPRAALPDQPTTPPAVAPAAVFAAPPADTTAELGRTTPHGSSIDKVIRSFLDRLDQ